MEEQVQMNRTGQEGWLAPAGQEERGQAVLPDLFYFPVSYSTWRALRLCVKMCLS